MQRPKGNQGTAALSESMFRDHLYPLCDFSLSFFLFFLFLCLPSFEPVPESAGDMQGCPMLSGDLGEQEMSTSPPRRYQSDSKVLRLLLGNFPRLPPPSALHPPAHHLQLSGHPSILPIHVPVAHAPNLVDLKLKTCSASRVLSRDAAL